MAPSAVPTDVSWGRLLFCCKASGGTKTSPALMGSGAALRALLLSFFLQLSHVTKTQAINSISGPELVIPGR